jgi:hypothetical protein
MKIVQMINDILIKKCNKVKQRRKLVPVNRKNVIFKPSIFTITPKVGIGGHLIAKMRSAYSSLSDIWRETQSRVRIKKIQNKPTLKIAAFLDRSPLAGRRGSIR